LYRLNCWRYHHLVEHYLERYLLEGQLELRQKVL
jgi:hypothetical protein